MKKIIIILFTFLFILTSCSIINNKNKYVFPIKLNDSREKITNILGKGIESSKFNNNIIFYKNSGITVIYNNFNKADKIIIFGEYQTSNNSGWLITNEYIFSELNIYSNINEYIKVFGKEKEYKIDISDKNISYYLWKNKLYIMEIEIWNTDYKENGKIYKKGSIKSITFKKGI